MRVTVNNLTFAYFNKIILKDLSFNLKSGDFPEFYSCYATKADYVLNK